MTKLQETLNFLNEKTSNFKPEIVIILGSGLGAFCENLVGTRIKYNEIPHFGTLDVVGHKGELFFCNILNKKCVVMEGRFHYYDGNSMEECAYPIEVLNKMGAKVLIITNASGATSIDYNVGDIMLVTDHINFMGNNPLIGKKENLVGDKFPDISDCYSKSLRKLALKLAKDLGIQIKEGVYLATTGPSYETPAEIRAFRLLGANVVGMSSVPEAIMANYLKMKTIAFSLITNHATGVSNNKLSHQEVLKIGKTSGVKLIELIKKMILEI